MLTLFVELALLAAVLFIIAYPLWRSHVAEPSGAAMIENEYSDLLYKKDAAYIALKDLEFDYKTGKIDDEDYKTMKDGMESDALTILKQIDGLKEGSVPAPQAAAEAAPGTKEKRKAKFCHNCGVKVDKGHKFCAECGEQL